MNLLFFQVRLFTVRVRLKLRASVALSPVFSNGGSGAERAEQESQDRFKNVGILCGQIRGTQ